MRTLLIVLIVLCLWTLLGEYLPVAKNFWVPSLLLVLFLYFWYLIFLMSRQYPKAALAGLAFVIISGLLGTKVFGFPENQVLIALCVLWLIPFVAFLYVVAKEAKE